MTHAETSKKIDTSCPTDAFFNKGVSAAGSRSAQDHENPKTDVGELLAEASREEYAATFK
jgi:hypothetical protein